MKLYVLQILYTERLCQALCLRMKNLPVWGRGLGHVTHFEILGEASYV